MNLYFSGRVLLYAKPVKNIKQRPEELINNTNVMMSYNYIKVLKSQDLKRFKVIIRNRKGKK